MFEIFRSALNKFRASRSRARFYRRWNRTTSDHRAMSMAQKLLRNGALTDSRTTGCPLVRESR